MNHCGKITIADVFVPESREDGIFFLPEMNEWIKQCKPRFFRLEVGYDL